MSAPALASTAEPAAASPPADEEPNEMMNLLQSHMPDISSISSYSRKRMPSRLLREAQAGTWLTALSTPKSNTRSKRQVRALTTTKFEREPRSYKEVIESTH